MDKLQCLNGEMNHTALNFEVLQKRVQEFAQDTDRQTDMASLLYHWVSSSEHFKGPHTDNWNSDWLWCYSWEVTDQPP
jgi:hypothetical protein